MQHAACRATLTLAPRCCLSREHVITEASPANKPATDRERKSERKNKDNAYRGSWQTLPSNLDRHLSRPSPLYPPTTSASSVAVIRVPAGRGRTWELQNQCGALNSHYSYESLRFAFAFASSFSTRPAVR